MFDAILTLVLQSTPTDWNSVHQQQQQPQSPPAADDSSDVDATSKESACAVPSDLATTPLHLILAYQPPVEVVDSMIHIVYDRFSILSPEEYPDQNQKTPLHIAVENFCDPEVTERLLAGESLLVPALLRDRHGRCALHYNCCTAADAGKLKKKNFFDRDPVAMNQFRQRQTLGILLEHYPEAAGLTDVNGKTPWDYAREMKLDNVNVRYLKKMYDLFVLKPQTKKQMTVSTTMDISDFSHDIDSDDVGNDELPPDLRSLNCSRQWMEQIDNDVSSIGDYEAEFYNTAGVDCDFDS
jgi:hypothetical protein